MSARPDMRSTGTRSGDAQEAVPGASRGRLTVNLGILASGEIATRGLTFLAFVHLARTLEPAFFGFVEWTFAVMQFCLLAVDQGLGILGARELARSPERTESFTADVVSTQLALAGIVFGGLLLASFVLPLDPAVRWLLRGFGVSLFAVPFVLNWVFQARHEMFWFAAPQVVRQGVFLLLVLLLVAGPADTLLLPLAEISAAAACAAVYVVVYRRRGFDLPALLRVRPSRKLLREGVPIGGGQLIWASRMYLPIVLLLFLVDQEQTGLFGGAHRIVMVFQAILGVYFTNLFPTFSVAAARERLGPLLARSLFLTLGLSLVLALAVSGLAQVVLGVIYGSAFVRPESVWSLIVLSWMVPVLAWRRHGRTALIVLHREREDLLCSIGGIVLLGVLLVPATLSGGAIGAAGAMLASELLTAAWTWWRLKVPAAGSASQGRPGGAP